MTLTKGEVIGYILGQLECAVVMVLACVGLYQQATKYQKRCAEYEKLLGIDPYEKYRHKFDKNATESNET